MQDPGYGVHRDLIQHVHLLSTYRYPLLPQLHHEKVAQLLLSAPKIARDQAPFYWTYLDRPATGTILLTWQPLNILGTDFASDGYIWAPAETAFQMEVNVDGGVYTLEMYQAKVGYAPGEQYATHSRKRYRLLPSKFQNPTGQTPDQSLWIVHYSDAAQQDRVPSNVIPVDIRTNTIMSTRQYLQSQGQIVQKEFMLHDRASWPQIQFPRGSQRGPHMYNANMAPVRVPQTMAYPPQHPAHGPPPSKRPRTQNNPGPPAAAMGAVLDAADDDEDTSRGDMFDLLTPREISTERYKLNHKWMEEILSSPYSMHQIVPPDLGLGLKGELAGVTDGIFDAPFEPDPSKRLAKYNYVGQLDTEKADDFRKRAKERISQTNNEIEKMKAKHARRMEKFKKGSIVTQAEKDLRTAVHDPTDTGSEYWRLEGRIDDEDGEDGNVMTKVPSKVDDILAQVVESLGKHTAAVQEIRRIQDGGFEEPQAVQTPPTQQRSRNGSHQSGRSGVMVGDADADMGESTAAGLLDQFHTGLSSTSTPGNSALNFPTPQGHLQPPSAAGTPVNLNAPSPQSHAHGTPQPTAQPQNSQSQVSLVNPGRTAEAVAPAEGSGTSDWVVVPPGGVSPLPSTSAQNLSSAAASADPTPQPEPTVSTGEAAPSNDAMPSFEADTNDFGDLGDLDTAGDALAGYGGDGDIGGDLGDLGVDIDMGMDDSAFGEAFHGVETRGADGETGDGDGI